MRGCWGSDFSHFHRAVRIMADPEPSAPWAAIEARRCGLGGAAQALADVVSRSVVKALIDPGA